MIAKEASEWRERPSYRAYAVLTLCRILYSGATGRIASKAAAATWALENAPREFHGLIRAAAAVSNDKAATLLDIDGIARLIGYARNRTELSPLETGD